MHLPFGNTNAIKHDRKDVQPAGPNQLGRWAWPSRLRGRTWQREGLVRSQTHFLPATLHSPGICSFKCAHLGPSLPGPVHGRSRVHSLIMHWDGY